MIFDASRSIRAVGWLVVFLAALVAARLYFLQVVEADAFRARADRSYAEGNAPFERGSIFFHSKGGVRSAAAAQQSGFALSVDTGSIGNTEEVYDALAALTPLTLSREAFLARANGNPGIHIEMAHRLGEAEAEAVRALLFPGVSVVREKWRTYPGETRAAHALGFVGYDGDRLVGRYGLERYYEDTLARAPASPYANFFGELLGYVQSGAHSREGDVTVGIEPTVQSFVETALKGIADTFSSRETGGIVMDPASGEVFALAALPSFDPNHFQFEKDWRVFVNPLVENVYEFGSIMKPLTLAAGIDAGAVTPSSVYRDEGFLERDGKTIYNFDKKARGVVDMQGVLNQSLNTGAAYVALTMGTKHFADYLRAFGLGDETGIDLPNEASGLITNLNSPREIEYITASFGQGIATTPIAMLRALSALANKGALANPHLAQRISFEFGGFRTPLFGEPKQVLKPETAEAITTMLVKVVDTALLGGTLKLTSWSVAAKTGTAQIANPQGGGYYADKYLHSFFGYFPAYEPRFIVFLYTVEPHGVSFASHTLTKPFFDIAKFLLNYYAVPPDR